MSLGPRFLDRFIVPLAFTIALLCALGVTVSWIARPTPPLGLLVSMGPPGIVPRHVYGLRFTPRNASNPARVLKLIPAQRHCVDVTIATSTLDFLDRQRACQPATRGDKGGYKLVYSFPRYADYTLFVEMHPVGGISEVYRLKVPLDRCTLRHPQKPCPPPPARLRGQESVRLRHTNGLTLVLGTPRTATAVEAHRPAKFVIIALKDGRSVDDLSLPSGINRDAIAISRDRARLVHLRPDPGQVKGGHLAGGAISYTGTFDRRGIYRVFAALRYHGRLVRTSFVIDVAPAPSPTPVPD